MGHEDSHAHGHTHEGEPNEFQRRAQACMEEVLAVAARHGCALRAVLQVGEGSVISPVIQIEALPRVEVPHG